MIHSTLHVFQNQCIWNLNGAGEGGTSALCFFKLTSVVQSMVERAQEDGERKGIPTTVSLTGFWMSHTLVICVKCLNSPSLPISCCVQAGPGSALLLANRLKSSRWNPGNAYPRCRDISRLHSLMIWTSVQFQKRSRIPGITLAFEMNVNWRKIPKQ